MAKQPDEIRILTVTDDPSAPRELTQMLGDESGTRVLFADTGNAVSRTFETESIDMVMINVDASDLQLLESTLRHTREQDRFIPVLAVIDAEDARSALTVAGHGVEGFVSGTNLRQLKRLAIQLVESLRARRDAKIALRSLEDIEARYTLLLDSSSEAIAYLHEGLHIYANPAYLELFGFEGFEDLEGLSMLDLFTPTDEVPDLKKVLKALSHDDIPREPMTLNAHRQDGSTFAASVDFSPARYGGEYCAQMLVREEVTHGDPALAEELKKLKTSDMLTGLLNAPAFVDNLKAELDKRTDTTGFSVLLMTIDSHDDLLDKVGVGATDALIKESADMFRDAVGEDAGMARLRDHTFAFFADLSDRDQAEKLAGSIVERCSDRIIEVRDTSLTVSASVGLSVAGSEVDSPEILVEHADQALNEAIRGGGNAFVRYRPRISADAEGDDNQWAERLRHALDDNEFGLVTSPITCMEDDGLLINEVETRLRDEENDEVLLPVTYMGPAARTGLAARIDQDMLARLKNLISERKSDSDYQWLVTLSLSTISDSEAVDAVESKLDEFGIGADRVIWGFRETEIREKLRPTQAFIERLRPKGCRFSLMDVTTENAIEPLLRYLDLDFIRLAPEAIQDIGNNDRLRDELSTLVSHAREHKVRIIAPKVENTGDLATLWQFGITLVQGDFVREEASA